MTSNGEERGIRRIIVAIDASPASIAALKAAAELAQQLGAELVGIFVEDVNLLRISGLPIARRIGRYSAESLPLDRAQIEQEMRVQAKIARRAMVEIAQRARLRSTFRVARGVIANELIQASNDADIIILGKSGWSRRKRLGSTTRLVIAQSPRHTLVIQQTFATRSLLGVVYDGSPGSVRALDAAVTMIMAEEGSLSVIILADDLETARQLQVEVTRWLQPRALSARYRWLVGVDQGRLASLAQSAGFGALVLSVDSPVLSGQALESFLEKIEVPVLLVH